MKKCVTLALVIMLVAIVALLPGCASDTKQAKAYMQQGDKLAKRYQKEMGIWFSNFPQKTAQNPIDSKSEAKAFLERLKASANDMSKTAGEAKAAYKKIFSLNAVGDYAKYADLEIHLLDKSQEYITLCNTYADKRVAMYSSGDSTDLTSQSEEFSKNVSKFTVEMNNLTTEAEKLKADKNL